MAAFDKGRLIDAPDATDKELQRAWIGMIPHIEMASSDHAKRRELLIQAFGPGPYKFLQGNRTLLPIWASGKAPYVAIEQDPSETLGPNSANFRVDLVEPFGLRTGGRWRFMFADPSNPRVAKILDAERGNLVLYVSLEKERDDNNRSAYRNVSKPKPGEFLVLYDPRDPSGDPIQVVVQVERIDQRYLLVELSIV